jgi:hypothetical protein
LLGEGEVVVRVLDDDLMRPQAAHLVVKAFAASLDVSLDAIDWPQVRNHSHLPLF